VLDDVRWGADMSGAFYKVDSDEAEWNSERVFEDGNMGHRPGVKGGYFPVPPVDSLNDLRAAMCLAMEEMGVPSRCITTRSPPPVSARSAPSSPPGAARRLEPDPEVLRAQRRPRLRQDRDLHAQAAGRRQRQRHARPPVPGKGRQNIFAGDKYGGLSETALYYIGGIIKHARALNAFTNASTNSYKRLVPGFEAPVMLAYSAKNRSASIRIPHDANPKATRIEVRFPDSTGNPYLSFSAMMMAGLDGIQNKIHPGDAMDKDLYDLPPEEEKAIPQVCYSLDQALDALDKDREFLTAGGVFTDDVIDGYIALKMEEVTQLRMTTHPVEFDLYYSLNPLGGCAAPPSCSSASCRARPARIHPHHHRRGGPPAEPAEPHAGPEPAAAGARRQHPPCARARARLLSAEYPERDRRSCATTTRASRICMPMPTG
jgi:glutamine synthetase